MKHLTTLLLTLLVSGNLWADDEFSYDKFEKVYENQEECNEILQNFQDTDVGFYTCQKVEDGWNKKYQLTFKYRPLNGWKEEGISINFGGSNISISSNQNDLANSTRYKPRTAPEPALCSETSSLKNIREHCSKKKVVSNVNNSSTSIASDLQTEVNQEEVTKEKSFFSKLLEAVVIGAVEGAVHNAISEDCEIETKAKSRQVIPGSPQYGNKVTITTTSKNCN